MDNKKSHIALKKLKISYYISNFKTKNQKSNLS